MSKIYCGSGKKKNDTWLKVTINPDKIKEHIQEFNGNRFVKLDVNIKPEPDQYGKDVSISVDTWQPEEKQDNNQQSGYPQNPLAKDDEPFPF